LVGGTGGIRPARFADAGCQLIHIAGTVNDQELACAGVVKQPQRQVASGYMAVATDYLGPRPVIDLHTAGLKVGGDVVRLRMTGASATEALAGAEASGLALRLDATRCH
jgi:hypothetical protein